MPNETELRVRVGFYLPALELEQLNQHLMETYGYIKGPRSAFIVKAIRERLEREKLSPMMQQKSKKGG